MKKHTRFAIATVILTLGVIVLGPELLLRLYHGKLLDVESLHRRDIVKCCGSASGVIKRLPPDPPRYFVPVAPHR